MLPICRLLGRRLCGAGWVNKEFGNAIELDTVGRQFEPNRWRPCEVIWDAVPEQSWLLKLRRKVAENPPFSSGRQVQVKVHRPGAAGSCSRSCHDLERLSLPSGTTASREGKSCSESGPDRRISSSGGPAEPERAQWARDPIWCLLESVSDYMWESRMYLPGFAARPSTRTT